MPELGERLVGQRAEQPHHRVGLQALVRAYRFGSLRCRAASEHGEPAGQRSFGVGEQLPAPPYDRDQRLVPRQRGPAAAGQQPVVEARGEFGGRQRAQPGAGQLDGQRQSIEAAADLGHRWQVLGGQPEPEHRGRGAVGEQPQRGGVHRFPEADRWRRHRQRRHRVDPLAGGGQRFAGRGEDPHPRAAAQEVVGQPGAGVEEVLAVVEHDQQLPAGELRGQLLRGGPQPERGADGRGDLGRVRDPRELGQPDSVRGLPADRDFGGEPGLAHPAGPDKRDQPRVREQRQHLC